jgi:hypothetical protein
VPRRSPRTLLAGVVLLALATGGAGCGYTAGRTAGDPASATPATGTDALAGSAPAPGSATALVSASELAGHWESPQYGDAYLQVQADEVRMVYTHDDGRVLASLKGTRIAGWWTEAPSRQPKNDAGDVEFTVVRGNGQLTLHGKWRFGDSEEFWYDWDLSKVDNAIPADVRSAFADPSQFNRHP